MRVLLIAFATVVVLFAVATVTLYSRLTAVPEVKWPASGYYGSGKPHKDDESIHPFKVQVTDAQIADLKQRLQSQRITSQDLEDVADFEYGMRRNLLENFSSYWLNSYDWRKVEAQLNKLPQFKTEIEGIHLHFVHQRPSAKYSKVVPILLSHGWPSSPYEFSKIIPILTDPQLYGIESELAFEVVAPSIPGYGWSSASKKSGMNAGAAARIFHKLMRRLNHTNYVVQGGDWGSAIVANMARLYPEEVAGCHLNMFFSTRLDVLFKWVLASFAPSLFLPSEPYITEVDFVATWKFLFKNGGYFHVQSTYPDSLGFGLNDSPTALLSWMLEKLVGATNMDYMKTQDAAGILKKYTKEELITFVAIYWFNGNMLQATRFYKENMANSETLKLQKQYIAVPVGYANIENDPLPAMPRALVEMSANLTHYSMIKDVGHFAAFEGAKPVALDLFAFVNKLDV